MNKATSANTANRRDAAEYIAALAGQLAEIAGAQQLDTLRYLLEMAQHEAANIAHADAFEGLEE